MKKVINEELRKGYLNENYHYFHLSDKAGQELDFHFHEFDKLVLLIAGKVEYTVEGKTYELKPWDVVYVKHHMLHKAVIDKSVEYERVIIYLDRNYFGRLMPDAELFSCFELSDRNALYCASLNKDQQEQIKISLNIFEENNKKNLHDAELMKDTAIMQILTAANRAYLSGSLQKSAEAPVYSEKIASTLTFIGEHLAEDLSVENIADRVYLSKAHFMRIFKAETGQTLHSYIRQKRLLKAASLIRHGMSASDAAIESGFSDYSSFHRAFKESFGVSPKEMK